MISLQIAHKKMGLKFNASLERFWATTWLHHPDGYKWKYVMIDVMYIDCWNSVYTIKRSNKDQVAEAFCKQHQESEDVA